ncbi:TIGR02234 family membrane protein [Tsukamurella sp. 1534]|uniref:TIGR02234 family membrane protein n=1 Tax=Tsukamurella sp. 1534 TaxID=1151061 RepID=UPI00030F1394|nr:TIGR02234 family membrane protein [Tsukamurella sp. 1534]
MKGKRNLAIAAVLMAAAAGLTWIAGRMTWMQVNVADGLTQERPMTIAGHQWAPALTLLPLVYLAAIAAALALKNWARGVVAVIVAAAAIGTAFPAVQVLTQEPDVAYIERVLDLAAKDYVNVAGEESGGPLVAILAAVVAVAAATLLLRGLRGGGMGSKYASPAARRAELERRVFDDAAAAQTSERDLWDALDADEDPTEGAKAERPDREG